MMRDYDKREMMRMYLLCYRCKRFSLESGTGMRRLNIVPKSGNRPDWLVQLQSQAKLSLAISIPRAK